MSESELKIALQREGEAQVRGFWQQSEAAVASRRQEADEELLRVRGETDRQLQAKAAVLSNTLRFAAQSRVMACRLRAEAALEERLLLLADQLLPALAGADRASLWQALLAELPATDWAALKIHPADRQQAGRDFPAAAIDSDAALGGGLIATSADGMLRIDNSLRCRLRRAWPDLLPQLLGELRKRVDNHETADPDTTG